MLCQDCFLHLYIRSVIAEILFSIKVLQNTVPHQEECDLFSQTAFQTQLCDLKLFNLVKPQFQHWFSLLSYVKRHNYTTISLTNFLFLSIYVISNGFPSISSGRALFLSVSSSPLPCTCVNYICFKWLF